MSAGGQSKTILDNGRFISNTFDESGNTYQREMQIDKNNKWTTGLENIN